MIMNSNENFLPQEHTLFLFIHCGVCWVLGLFIVFLCFGDRMSYELRLILNSMCSRGYPWTPNPPASSSQVLRVQAWTTIPGPWCFILYFTVQNNSPTTAESKLATTFSVSSSLYVNVCVCRYGSACVCKGNAHAYVCLCVEAQSWRQLSSSTSSFYSCRKTQSSPVINPLSLPLLELHEANMLAWLLCGFWGPEIQSSRLFNKHFLHWAMSPGLCSFLYQREQTDLEGFEYHLISTSSEIKTRNRTLYVPEFQQ